MLSTSSAPRRRSPRRSRWGTSASFAVARSKRRQPLRSELVTKAVVGGERNGVVVEGFDVGAPLASSQPAASPRPGSSRPRTAPRAILSARERCETVFLGSLLNWRGVGGGPKAEHDVVVYCAGFKGCRLDDAYCADGSWPTRRRAERCRRGPRELLRARSARRSRAERTHLTDRQGSKPTSSTAPQENLLETVPRLRDGRPAAESWRDHGG